MLLSRTRAKWAFAAREKLHDVLGIGAMLDEREQRELELHMGFRGQWDEHRRFQIDLLKDKGLLPHHDFLEVGCGPLTAGLPLIAYLDEGRYTGVDVRPTVSAVAWRQIGKAGLAHKNPRIICANDFGAGYLGDKRFDYMLSFSVLYHLSDEILDGWFEAVAKRLNEHGQCFANVNTETPSDKWLEFPFLRRTIEDYRRRAEANGLQCENLGTLESLGFRLVGPDRLNQLLRFTRS